MSTAEIATTIRPQRAWGALRLLRRPTARVGAVIVLVFLLLPVLPPLSTPYDPLEQAFENALRPPSAEHVFGTDQYGRDVLSRVMYGSRTALLAIFVADGLALVLGCGFGLIAGYVGTWVDSAIMRVV